MEFGGEVDKKLDNPRNGAHILFNVDHVNRSFYGCVRNADSKGLRKYAGLENVVFSRCVLLKESKFGTKTRRRSVYPATNAKDGTPFRFEKKTNEEYFVAIFVAAPTKFDKKKILNSLVNLVHNYPIEIRFWVLSSNHHSEKSTIVLSKPLAGEKRTRNQLLESKFRKAQTKKIKKDAIAEVDNKLNMLGNKARVINELVAPGNNKKKKEVKFFVAS